MALLLPIPGLRDVCDWHWAFTADQGHSQGPVGFVRFPLGQAAVHIWELVLTWGRCRGGVSLHSPSVSLVGVKKRNQSHQEQCEPCVWNEVCPLWTSQGAWWLFQWCHPEEGLWSGSPRNPPGTRSLGGEAVAWPGSTLCCGRSVERSEACTVCSSLARPAVRCVWLACLPCTG